MIGMSFVHHLCIVVISYLLPSLGELEWSEVQSPFDGIWRAEGSICGFSDNSIWLLGGNTVTEYNLFTNTTTTHDGILDYITASSQCYTQIEDKLYIYPSPDTSDYIVTFNMQSKAYNNQFITKHNTTLISPCITNKDSDWLFVLGGYHWTSPGKVVEDGFHILDMIKAEWIQDGPTMIDPLEFHACNAHSNGYLYVIPGQTYDDWSGSFVPTAFVRMIDVSNITNINNVQWTMLGSGDILNVPRSYVRSVLYAGSIYIIGGLTRYNGKTNKVEVIDTLTNTIRWGLESTLATEVSSAAAVVARDTLYVFGGDGISDTMQYAQLPPTSEPTGYPTQGTLSPTVPPTSSPSNSPTHSPTRYPTQNVEDIYNASFLILYSIHNLTLQNIQKVEDHSLVVLPDIIEIIERHYGVQYKDFMIRMDSFHMYPSQMRQLSIRCTILSRFDVVATLIFRSNTSQFEEVVTANLIDYFANNSDVLFSAQIYEAAGKEVDISPSFMLILSISIIVCGFVFSMLVKMLNRCPNGKVDNAKWMVPFLYSLQVYDFVSDLNLSRIIWMNPSVYSNTTILLCGIGSVVFMIIPYSLNLLYGIRIKKQQIITNNERADVYFVDSIGILIALIVMSGGMYPSLLVCSSRIFNLESLDSGLSKHELYQLAKIKLRSTVIWEDFPNLVIQIAYTYSTSVITTDVFMAFIASVLSIILAFSTYFANRISRKHSVFVSYYLLFMKLSRLGNDLSETEKSNVSDRKGRKEELERSMANIFAISHETIEIGFVTVTNNGLKMAVSHSLSTLKLLKYFKTEDIKTVNTSDMQRYVGNRFETYWNEINAAFRAHFEVNDEFVVQYVGMDDTGNNQLQQLQKERDDDAVEETETTIEHELLLYEPARS